MATEGRSAAAVREAVVDADVGAADLYVGLAALGGLGEVTVTDGRASIEVTLPVPAASIRQRLARDLVAAATGVEGVDAATVSWQARAADPGTRLDVAPDVRHVLAVASGKGGVGKSTVAVNVATALADAGATVGLLDADVYGPNAPAMLGLSDATPRTTRDDEMRPREGHGVKAMSMGFVVDEDDPVIWRGPLVDDVLAQLFDDVAWGDLDYLVVDMPPGTGDAHLSLVQHVPVTGAVVVTTPQPVAAEGATRALTMFTRYDVPVLGLVENMTAFECPDCGGEHDVFGSGGAAAVADQFDVPVLGRLPLDPAMQSAATGPDDADGHSLPILGSLSLPRFREERERATHRPPVVVRDDDGAVRDAARVAATRVAARADAYATR